MRIGLSIASRALWRRRNGTPKPSPTPAASIPATTHGWGFDWNRSFGRK